MEKETLAKRFRALIRDLRLAKGYSQERFGEVWDRQIVHGDDRARGGQRDPGDDR